MNIEQFKEKFPEFKESTISECRDAMIIYMTFSSDDDKPEFVEIADGIKSYGNLWIPVSNDKKRY